MLKINFRLSSISILLCSATASLIPLNASAALDNGTAELLAKGDRVFIQPFHIKKEISLSDIKVHLQLQITVKPEKANQLIKTLKLLKTPGGHKLFVTGITQTTTTTGLINLTAQLVGHLPITDIADISQLIKKHTSSGSRLTLLSTTAYFPDRMRQQVENKMTLHLYQRAKNFAQQLNKTAKPSHYVIGAMQINQANIQQPRPLMMTKSFANTASMENSQAPQMQKTIYLFANVTYVASTHRK